LLRGQGDDLPLLKWLHDVVYRHSAILTIEQAYLGAALAYAEMLKNGITTVVDFFYLNGLGNDYAEATIRAAEDLGIRLTLARTFMDWDRAPATVRETRPEARRRYRDLAQRYRGNPLVRICPAAHSVYAASNDMLEEARNTAEEFNTKWHMHVADSVGSERQVRASFGCSTIRHLEKSHMLNERLVAVHAVYVDENEAELLGQAKVAVSHNPAANMFLGDKAAPILALRRQGVMVGLGTDSGLDNNSLSIFHEMKLAALVQKSGAGNPEAITAPELIEMATTNGSAIAEWPAGRLAPGYAADFLVIDCSDMALVPGDRLASHMVYSMSDRAIRAVYVNGKCVVRDRQLVGIAEQELIRRVNAATRSLCVIDPRRKRSTKQFGEIGEGRLNSIGNSCFALSDRAFWDGLIPTDDRTSSAAIGTSGRANKRRFPRRMCRPEIADQAAISQVGNRSSLGMVGEQDRQRRIAAAIIPPISSMI
jgi:5-methylthioadenosine/S-adenosylhomocysteine deaminase